MANHQKTQKGEMAKGILLLKHDKRDDPEQIKSNPDINPELTHLNLRRSLVERTSSEAWKFAREYSQEHAKGGRKLRNNAVVMSSEVIHLPKNWDEVTRGADPAKFFDEVAIPFYRQRYGYKDCENEISCEVHFDERHKSKDGRWVGEPHLHYKYVPITPDGRTCHKEVNNREDLKSLHPDLVAFAESKGYKGLALFDPTKSKEGRTVEDMDDYKMLMDQRDEIAQECNSLAALKESLQADVTELEAEQQHEEGEAAGIDAGIAEQENRINPFQAGEEERLDEDIAGLEEAINAERARLTPEPIAQDEAGILREVEQAIQEQERGIAGLEAAISAEADNCKHLDATADGLRSNVDVLKRGITALRDRIRELPSLIEQVIGKLPMPLRTKIVAEKMSAANKNKPDNPRHGGRTVPAR